MGASNILGRALRWLAVATMMLAFVWRSHAQEVATASINRIDPLVVNGQLSLDIDIELQLNTTMRQALSRGVPLYFSLDLEIEQPRWWWLNKTIVDTSLERRLSYNALTRSWRVSTGDLSVPTASYEEAMTLLTRIRDWPVVMSDRFEPDEQYIGRVRIRLDADQLARPLQMDTVNRSNFSLSSPWKPFEFSIRRGAGAQR
jgi:hypothetical protein